MDPSQPIETGPEPHRTPECVQCRYDLTGFSVGATCPECGRQITDLYPALEFSRLATAAAVCGALSLCMILSASLGDDLAHISVAIVLILGFFGLGLIGVVLALLARRAIRKSPFRHARGSMAIARSGFWMSAPALIVLSAGIGVEMLRPFVYG